MHGQPDTRVCELGATCLTLRSDLVVTPQTSEGRPYYVLEDPLNSRFFRLGHAEYTFVSLIDGATSVHAALGHLSTVKPDHCLTESDVAALCRWLVEMDLAQTAASSQGDRLAGAASKREKQRAASGWNPVLYRAPLWRGDAFYAWAAAWMGWLFSPMAALVWAALIVVGAYHVLSDWDRFAASSHTVFAPGNWPWLAACWIGLKIVHETAHGVACKRYGGAVRETGVLFVLFAPLAYVDVSSSWRFPCRWRRVHVAAAGIYVEWLIAALMAVAWSGADSGWISHLCFNVILMTSLSTLLFNANPLMKFDGYYMLSDALGMPNLYANGRCYLRYWARRRLLGVGASPPNVPPRQEAFVRLYAWSSFVWRILICLSLTIAAAALFHGAGVVLACLAVAAWLVLPGVRFVKYFIYGRDGETPKRLRFILIVGSSAAVLGLLGLAPWPGGRSAPAVVDYSPQIVLRAASSGLLKEAHVVDGQDVEKGQELFVLVNHELTSELFDLELQIQQSAIRGRMLKQKGDLAGWQAEIEKREALQVELAEKRFQVERLVVRAPCRGKIVRRNLSALVGMHFREGGEIALLGNEAKKELRLSISQDDMDGFNQGTVNDVWVDAPGRALFASRVAKANPRATLFIPHPALVAVNGGPLAVKPAARQDDGADRPSHELLEPRFTAIVPLSEAESRGLYAGQMANVVYRPFARSVAQHLYTTAARWIRRRVNSRTRVGR